MIKSIGTDIVDLGRLKDKGESFINRVLNEKERVIYDTITDVSRRLTFLGGRFACKEALSKAISTGTGQMNFKDFVILNGANGKPYLVDKPDILKDVIVHLSIAHTKEYAIAYVILEIT